MTLTPSHRRAIRKRRAEREARFVIVSDTITNRIDEAIVSPCLAHLEQLDDDHYFLCLTKPDGSSLAIWLRAEDGEIVTSFERRPKP